MSKRNLKAIDDRANNRAVHMKQFPALRRHIIAATFIIPNQDILGAYVGLSRSSIQKILNGEYVRHEISSPTVLAAMKKVASGERDKDRRRVMDFIIIGFDKRHVMAHSKKVDLPIVMAQFVNENDYLPKSAVIKHFTDQGVGSAQCHTAWRRMQERLLKLPELMMRFKSNNSNASEAGAVVRFNTLPETIVAREFNKDYK